MIALIFWSAGAGRIGGGGYVALGGSQYNGSQIRPEAERTRRSAREDCQIRAGRGGFRIYYAVCSGGSGDEGGAAPPISSARRRAPDRVVLSCYDCLRVRKHRGDGAQSSLDSL